MEFRTAVLHEAGKPLTVERVRAQPLNATDVLVRVGASGLCHRRCGCRRARAHTRARRRFRRASISRHSHGAIAMASSSLDELITQRISLDDVNAGFATMKDRGTLRSVVVFA